MALGIVLHASNVYAPTVAWIVDDPESNPFFDLLTASIHAFRMPAFFWVSGFFCAMTFARSGSAGVVRSRLPRLLIPLIATVLTLNVLQDVLVGTKSGITIQEVLTHGPRTYHLWFLVNLIVYVAVAALLLPILSPRESAKIELGGWRALAYFAAIVISTYLMVLAARATGAAYVDVFGLFTVLSLAKFALHFGVGAWMYFRRDLRSRFLAVPAWAFVPAVALAIYLSPLVIGHASLATEAAQLLHTAAVWIAIAAVLGWCHRAFRRRTTFTSAASESTYTVYLFHHVTVVAVALALLPFAWGPWIKFALVCASTAGITLATHYLLIGPHAALSLLFNGQLPRRAASDSRGTTPRRT